MIYILKNPEVVCSLLLQHLQITLVALLIAVLVALPTAGLIRHYRWLKIPVISTLSILYTVPSLALIILLVPILGLNARSVIAAIAIYSQVILVRNITAGLQAIDPAVLEAAQGMGMNAWQRWWWVQIPLILPIFLAGLRLAAIVGIAIATIGAKFGAGGLGVLLFDGIAQAGRYDKIWAGAIAVSILAFAINAGLLALEKMTNPLKQTPLKPI
ncbi:MAG: ABC transporter permease [Cyanothece sp. SIO1E1]|nr:ABC transporter permease [Cyanothece sp. SIO1E1]